MSQGRNKKKRSTTNKSLKHRSKSGILKKQTHSFYRIYFYSHEFF